MKLSIAICTHNEAYYVKTLLHALCEFVKRDPSYEIVVIDDNSTNPATVEELTWRAGYGNIKLFTHRLDDDFAAHKNFMNAQCTGDFILNLDADEMLSTDLLSQIPLIIESNPAVDAYWFPRVNTVEGLTLAHVQKWGWVITSLPEMTVAEGKDAMAPGFYELLEAYKLIYKEEHGFVYYHTPIIQWPDPQMRLYRNDPKIVWEGKVHERLTGYENFTHFPMSPEYAIIHAKEIGRQEQQNAHYERIQ